jgi:esterase/lipase
MLNHFYKKLSAYFQLSIYFLLATLPTLLQKAYSQSWDQQGITKVFKVEQEFFLDKIEVKNQTEECVLILPGYPGGKSKNEDIAQALSRHLKIPSFILHYPGIGKAKGYFSFTKSKDTAIKSIQEILDYGFKKITLIGNSWGGHLSLEIFNQCSSNISRLILISPLSFKISDEDVILAAIRQFLQNEKDRSYNLSEKELSLDFNNQSFNPSALVNKKNIPILLIHGKIDSIIPIQHSEQLTKLPSFRDSDFLILQNEDHDIQDRELLIKEITSYLTK